VKELENAFPENEELNLQSINKCDYLNAYINETLRLYPPAPVYNIKNLSIL
jgi:cytochrome P450